MSFIALRIGGFQPDDTAHDPRKLIFADLFVSHRDLNQLIHRCIDADDRLRFAVFHGLSNNRFNCLDLSDARELVGYVPEDDFTAMNPTLTEFRQEDVRQTEARARKGQPSGPARGIAVSPGMGRRPARYGRCLTISTYLASSLLYFSSSDSIARRSLEKRGFQFADALLQAGADARADGLVGRIGFLGFLHGNDQTRHLLDPHRGAVPCVDESGIAVDLVEVEKFLDRAQGGRTVKLFGRSVRSTNPCLVRASSGPCTRVPCRWRPCPAGRSGRPWPRS